MGLSAWAFRPDAHKGNAGSEDILRIERNQMSKQVLSEGEEQLALHLQCYVDCHWRGIGLEYEYGTRM